VTHTALQDRPEWHVKICAAQIENIGIFNRTDCCSDRLSGANVWVRRFSITTPGTWEHVVTLKKSLFYNVHVGAFRGAFTEVAIKLDGRARYLSLAEVRISGFPIGQCFPP
jgi:hypothetical protein